ncbi:hypothetical protein GCM10011490_24440 [Pseudoclavibacter endophyticus]|uniref:Uncharacterized protein n=1 Tax=Pseudoclavibacter endophyticus TaxID=1778590 RepID=A0A6H9WPF9_9MICO|nr:hypothetical protein [Pseudoclavibacter endophyticus]KAB1647785.1 hypothetical protein F8O04_12215 [Pseudoclavibacter endophyticus]GGA72770.1 hypothetical protein GCM10011490_24440 [Pseudoclavibacter endophyticus]
MTVTLAAPALGVSEGVLTILITTGGGLVIAVFGLIGVIVKMRGDRAVGRDEIVEQGTKTLLDGLGKEVARLNAAYTELDAKVTTLREQLDILRGQLRDKMRAVGRILLHLDRHMDQPPDLGPIQSDLNFLEEDGVVPIRWGAHNRIKEN